MRQWLAPLCAHVPALAAAGGDALDHHKSFVVRYKLGEDEQLSAHYDNAEVTPHGRPAQPGSAQPNPTNPDQTGPTQPNPDQTRP